MRTHLLALAALFAVPLTAHAADVYRCTDKGLTTYQDFPCKTQDGATGARVIIPESPPAKPGNGEDLQTMKNRVDAMARDRRNKEIAAEIAALDGQIARIEKEGAAEIEALQQKRGYAANNFQTEPYEKGRVDRALFEEMTVSMNKTRDRTEGLRKRVATLRDEQKALAPTNGAASNPPPNPPPPPPRPPAHPRRDPS